MGLIKGAKIVKEFQYDFAKDGGAVSSISLKSVDNSGDVLPENFIVEEVMAYTETALTSGGTPTITIGPTADTDGYLADLWAGQQSAGATQRSGEVAGALLWDDTNDHEISYRVTSTANTQDIVLAIGTAALTAGKLKVVVKGYIPTSRNRVV